MSTQTLDKLFPKLSDSMIESLKSYGTVESNKAGDILFDAGEKEFDFFVVLSGSVRISDPYNDDRMITVHMPGEFTGDVGMLSKRVALVQATMGEPGDVIRIPPEKLKLLISSVPEVSDVLLQAFLLRREELISKGGYGARIIGSRYSPDTFRIREFLSRNNLPYTWLDVESDPLAAELLEQFDVKPEETPIVIARDNAIYKNPTLQKIGACMGISDHQVDAAYDVVVVGAGPAGLAASVYAASEGLKVLTLDGIGPGGQAGTSSKIENYLGFPTGISGGELARRADLQVQKFGGTIASPCMVKKLARVDGYFTIEYDDGEVVRTRSVVIASGARYRKLNLPGLENFEGKGIYYGATHMEAQTCMNEDIVLVGGGNSAGQGAMFLSQTARTVHIVIRSDGLEHSMSRYLISRIEMTPNIILHRNTQIASLHGKDHLQSITLKTKGAESFDIETQNLFTFIGAQASTDWVQGCVALDEKGFVLTETQLTPDILEKAKWQLERPPRMLETSVPGVYAVGDVRSGSTKRVASAVGEGSMSISFVHQFLVGS